MDGWIGRELASLDGVRRETLEIEKRIVCSCFQNMTSRFDFGVARVESDSGKQQERWLWWWRMGSAQRFQQGVGGDALLVSAAESVQLLAQGEVRWMINWMDGCVGVWSLSRRRDGACFVRQVHLWTQLQVPPLERGCAGPRQPG